MPNDENSHNKSSFRPLQRKDLGKNVPRRGGVIIPRLANLFLKGAGWKAVGEIPDVPKAVYLALPHTSNIDGVFSIPMLLALDLNIKILGKKSLFKNPIMAKFISWAGVIPIDRDKKGSILQATIDRMNNSDTLHLGLSPEGTREYTSEFKTGFYYIAHEAKVPIVPVAMDYKTKEFRFMTPVYTTGNYDADFSKIISQYKGVVGKHPDRMAQPLQDINKDK